MPFRSRSSAFDDPPTTRCPRLRLAQLKLPSIPLVLFGRRAPWRARHASDQGQAPVAPATPGPAMPADPTFLPTPFTISPRFMPNAWMQRQSREWWFTPNDDRESSDSSTPPPFIVPEPTLPAVELWTRHTYPKLYQNITIGKRLKLRSADGKRLRYRVCALIGPVGPGLAILAEPRRDPSLPPAAVLFLPRDVPLDDNLEELFRQAVDDATLMDIAESPERIM